ncbi:MAG: SUMF1/EgtB/PvdO family nonheme iron enzyme, partial [Chloroflexota bacterium]
MATIFLSHSQKDNDIMLQVKKHLEGAGFSVWIDEDLERGSPDRQKAIEVSIRECYCLVVLLSPDSFKSKWVRKEVSLAAQMQRWVLPILIRGERKEMIPIALEKAQYIDLRSDMEMGLIKLVEKLEEKGLQNNPEIDTNLDRKINPIDTTKKPSTSPIEKALLIGPDTPAEIEWVHIPAGKFIVGSNEEGAIEQPYFIGKYPVTNSQYKKFVDAVPEQAVPHMWDPLTKEYPIGKGSHPATYVSWYDAESFCKWNGGRLPTELEWEKAARGETGLMFPWGNDWEDGKYANTIEIKNRDTTPVDQYPAGASPYGVMDLSGNVWEWTNDWFDERMNFRVLKGGSWNNYSSGVRANGRYDLSPGEAFSYYGFRCV